jgi:hypothetical protein
LLRIADRAFAAGRYSLTAPVIEDT